MNEETKSILANLAIVDFERRRRLEDPRLASRVEAIKRYQHARFSRTYADLLVQANCGPAARFFLDELYGPRDFTERDAQFSRIVPAMVRLFPAEVVKTVARLAELHALSENLDTQMGLALSTGFVDGNTYSLAWRTVGTPEIREHQIQLMLGVGTALERFTRNPLLRHSLRVMRGPARVAGLRVLQQFLETGFDRFGSLNEAQAFLSVIADRERDLAASLFSGRPGPNIEADSLETNQEHK